MIESCNDEEKNCDECPHYDKEDGVCKACDCWPYMDCDDPLPCEIPGE